jgi:uncharacterized protein (DUF302 family)
MAAALTLALGGTTWAQTASLVRVDTASRSPFAKTVTQLETAIKARGMMIVATIDHQNMLRMVGATIKGSKTLEFGKPDMGKMVLTNAPEAGLEMPAKLYVYEGADGKTVVSYYKPSGGFDHYGKEPTSMAGQMMDKTLADIVAEGTQ